MREYPRLVTLLAAVTGHRGVAEELAQEALIRAHQRWRRVSRYDLPAAWLRRVALNLASNHRARQRTEDRTLRRLGGERPAPERTTDDDGFWALVRQLPERQAAAVALYYLEDRPVAQVAAILDCAEGTAKAHLHKGRATLARLLDHPEGS
ncbi:RNA polymerase sigma factor [Aquihabitans sp. G128]|uniref:sigma-70 family RNA polymerase sigma factor n=1 Tax=Aquihabitans sp. G128 TaxID=2849779 RepID=UPI001C229F9A|nr:RNA polymerase sigma factor [Aquihabitans sp. G128]